MERALTIWKASNTLVLGLLFDWRTGQLKRNEKRRAKGIVAIVTALGPTFIKIGQTLSIRPDIIPQVGRILRRGRRFSTKPGYPSTKPGYQH